MIKNILLGISLLSFAAGVLANDTCGSQYQHCTNFVDQLTHPSDEGYSMQHYTIDSYGNKTATQSVCVNAEMGRVFLATQPSSSVTEYWATDHWQMGYQNEDGSIEYQDYAATTFFVKNDGSVVPGTYEIFIDSDLVPVTCSMSDGAQMD